MRRERQIPGIVKLLPPPRQSRGVQQIKDKMAAKTRAEAAEKAQRDNTVQFLTSFDQLNEKLNDLQTKVATEPLRSELAVVRENLATVRDDLQKTQLALVPPKASLIFTFPGFQRSADDKEVIPNRVITLSATPEGVVTIPINIINPTETEALQGHINFIICDGCKYAKEPRNMGKIPDSPEQLRDYSFPQILASELLTGINLDVIPPKGMPTFHIAVQHRCHTCVLQRGAVQGVINVNWAFTNPRISIPPKLLLPPLWPTNPFSLPKPKQ